MEDKKDLDLTLEEKQQQQIEINAEVSATNPEQIQQAFEGYEEEKYKLWERKIKLTIPAVQEKGQTAFQSYVSKYNEAKYGIWQLEMKKGTPTPTTEQIQFNEYIKLLQSGGNIKDNLKIVKYEGDPITYEGAMVLTSGQQSVKISQEDVSMLKKRLKDSAPLEEQPYILIYIEPNKVSNKNNMSIMLYGKYRGVTGNDLVNFTGIGYTTGTDNSSTGGHPLPPPTVDLTDYLKQPEKYNLEIGDFDTINESSFRKTNASAKNQPLKGKKGIVLTLKYDNNEMAQTWWATDNTANRQRYHRIKRNGQWSNWSLISHKWTLPEWDNAVTNLDILKYSGTFRTTNSPDTIISSFPEPVRNNKDGFVEYYKYDTAETNYKGYQKFLSMQGSTAGKIFERYNVNGRSDGWSTWIEVGTGSTPQPQPVDIKQNIILEGIDKFSYEQHVKNSLNFRVKLNINNNSNILDKIKNDDFVIITYTKDKITNKKNSTVNIYGIVKGKQAGLISYVEIGGMGHSVGANVLSEEEIEQLIQQHSQPQPQPQPGVSGGLIKLPTDEERLNNIPQSPQAEGEYGVNLLDYKHISRSPQLGVGGQYVKAMEQKTLKPKEIQYRTDGHTIFNKYKHLNNKEHTTHLYGGVTGISGIKKGVDLHFDDNWYKLKKSESESKLIGNFVIHMAQETLTEHKLEENIFSKIFTDASDSETYQPTHHGRYWLELGTDKLGDTPSKYMLDFKAYYGTLVPDGIGRDFEFAEYKGVTLRANHVLKDLYFERKLGDVLVRKVGVVKFKDLDWKHSVEFAGYPAHYIYAKVPYDCKVPPSISGQSAEMVRLGKQLLTNNLTELSPDNDTHLENIPFDKYPPYLEQIITNLPWGDKEKPEWCFLLITSPENAKRHAELLEKTEITYELKDEYQEPIFLQQGGFTITLSTGKTLNSYDYKEIKEIKEENAYELTSVDDTTIKISKLQIVDVTPNIK